MSSFTMSLQHLRRLNQIIKHRTCFSTISIRFCKSDVAKHGEETGASAPEKQPRSLLEAYAKNPHWLGNYNRVTLVDEPILKKDLESLKLKEYDRNGPSDVKNLMDMNAVWEEGTFRCPAIAVKLGQSIIWNKYGDKEVVTLVHMKECTVLDTYVSREDGGKDEETSVVVGGYDVSEEDLIRYPRETIEWYTSRGITPKRFWTKAKIPKNALLLPGTEILPNHFVPGQMVCTLSNSQKLGFLGVMQRWGMKGQPATHGQTKTHRKMGATGGGGDPGRIWPGKRMAGHKGGGRQKTVCQIYSIDYQLKVLTLKGTIPGAEGDFVILRDEINRKYPMAPPFPTYFKSDQEEEFETVRYADHVAQPSQPSLEFPPYKV